MRRIILNDVTNEDVGIEPNHPRPAMAISICSSVTGLAGGGTMPFRRVTGAEAGTSYLAIVTEKELHPVARVEMKALPQWFGEGDLAFAALDGFQGLPRVDFLTFALLDHAPAAWIEPVRTPRGQEKGASTGCMVVARRPGRSIAAQAAPALESAATLEVMYRDA